MIIDLYNIIKSAVKDALREHSEELLNKHDNFSQETSTPLLTVKQFAKKHTFMTESGLRSFIFHSEYNGFNIVFTKIGRKILIDEKKALEWFKNPPSEAKATCYQSSDKKTIYKYKK